MPNSLSYKRPPFPWSLAKKMGEGKSIFMWLQKPYQASEILPGAGARNTSVKSSTQSQSH